MPAIAWEGIRRGIVPKLPVGGAFFHQAPDELTVLLARRQRVIALDPPPPGLQRLARAWMRYLLGMGLPVEPRAAFLPAGQVVEVQALCGEEELILPGHRHSGEMPGGLARADALSSKRPEAMGIEGIAAGILVPLAEVVHHQLGVGQFVDPAIEGTDPPPRSRENLADASPARTEWYLRSLRPKVVSSR